MAPRTGPRNPQAPNAPYPEPPTFLLIHTDAVPSSTWGSHWPGGSSRSIQTRPPKSRVPLNLFPYSPHHPLARPRSSGAPNRGAHRYHPPPRLPLSTHSGTHDLHPCRELRAPRLCKLRSAETSVSARGHLRGCAARAGPRAPLSAPRRVPPAPGTLRDSPAARSPARGRGNSQPHTQPPSESASGSVPPHGERRSFSAGKGGAGKAAAGFWFVSAARRRLGRGLGNPACNKHAEGKRGPRAEPGHKFGRRGREACAAGSRTWKCWKTAEMRVICKPRHLDEQRARWTLTADRDSSSRRAAAAPGPPARQPPEAASQTQRVRAAPGAPGTMAAGRGRGRRAQAEAPSSAPRPHCREPRGRRNSAGKFNHSTPAPRLPRQPPPCAASRGGARVTGGRAIGWKESE